LNTRIGSQLVDKIHVDVGDMDNFYLNLVIAAHAPPGENSRQW
jgi:hypothetical protein